MSSDQTSEYAIEVMGLSKCYEIYGAPRDRLKQILMRGRKQYFKEFWALKDVDFKIKKGETVGIIGRNGSGKSTLLQMICGILNPTAGDVKVNGRVAALLELGSGFNTEFTGIENICLYAAILGLQPQEIAERLGSILNFAGIGEFAHQPIKNYSSGMVIRLAFATIIHMNPQILVIDEALAVGDTVFQQKCLSRIREMQSEGVSILLVTHSTNTVIEYCDRAIFLKNGELIATGSCRDVVKLYVDDLVDQEGGEANNPRAGSMQSAPNEKEVISTIEKNTPEQNRLPLEIVDVKLVSQHGQRIGIANFGDQIKVIVRIRTHKEVDTPCCGIQIASVDGITLWSATSQNMGVEVSRLPIGLNLITWELTLNFGGGRYIFAIGAGEILNGEYHRYHRIDCAGYMDIIPQKNQGAGWLAPAPKLFFENAHNN